MTKTEQIQQAARLWTDRSQRDVAEIRLDDLLNPTAEDAIAEIHWYGNSRSMGYMVVTHESGAQVRITL